MPLKNNFPDLKKLRDGYYYHCQGKKTRQIMACVDLENKQDLSLLRGLIFDKIDVVYSDPPWNPGNRKYWRTNAGKSVDGEYEDLLIPWTDLVDDCIKNRGCRHVFTEQSQNDEDRKAFVDLTKKWDLPLKSEYTVYYGSPGSRSRQHPNKLLFFSNEELKTDPSGLDGEPMTIRACAGIDAPPGSTVLDPCIGKGMTSRMALYFQWNCIGSEISPKRLGKTITWLQRKDFEITEEKI